ncbi:hypothetical protein CWI36_1896p0010 [Hamiltosporidium magnivora]|uniref:Uncharacterized protein n=1 Tax=Hamiltosporidium magnivora TaxID=148818 RepID=A0A4Q9KXG2_9MICR|nr:hypothetical protein CWI36_1896p0010 [Hamiltosporidium magnivora]
MKCFLKEKKCKILDFGDKVLNKSEEILKEEIGKVVVNNTRNLDLIQQINCVVQYRDIFTKDNNMQKFLSTINLHAKKFFNYIIGVLRLEPVEISRLRTAILIY